MTLQPRVASLGRRSNNVTRILVEERQAHDYKVQCLALHEVPFGGGSSILEASPFGKTMPGGYAWARAHSYKCHDEESLEDLTRATLGNDMQSLTGRVMLPGEALVLVTETGTSRVPNWSSEAGRATRGLQQATQATQRPKKHAPQPYFPRKSFDLSTSPKSRTFTVEGRCRTNFDRVAIAMRIIPPCFDQCSSVFFNISSIKGAVTPDMFLTQTAADVANTNIP